ncbi:hypothetical protein LTR70_003222 [Exophiala xenobiotica]|uniref:Putative phospholipase n=1 Tax=Lithohypha guttulata TaxID=1690604 RepID=A0ABR0KGY9_9EURO|nr:hypothetical protein LTR24_002867 [Lithohypha guttulata]KAK5323734.1 hypothetical protein LTR70_003222 [Exophiala xenobiotica]
MLSYLNPLPALPQYRGPHKVGTSEFEIPISEIPSASTVPDERITTIKFRIYYPTVREATSKESVYWLPSPQKQWNEAYASFMGASERYSSMMSSMLNLWNFAKLPVVRDAPLSSPQQNQGHPVCIFSHGLGGNFNTYSSIVGSLASCGVVCVAIEHRDGSAPISFIKNAKGEIETSIAYQKLSHAPNTRVLNARNAQLRVRLWELELTYAVIKAMNEGKQFTNYAADSRQSQSVLKDQLNLQPGHVSWAGHSFGAATMTQFVKSVFYHEYLPEPPQLASNEARTKSEESGEQWDYTPLYKTTASSALVKQVTPESPVALLDCWTMPLRGETTKWLWERPMPCYYRQTPSISDVKPNMVAIMSAEFYKWTDLLNRTRSLLSKSPVAAVEAFEQQKKRRESEAPSIEKDETRAKNPVPELSKEDQDVPIEHSPGSSAASSKEHSPARSIGYSEPGSSKSSSTSLVPSEHEGGKIDSTSSTEPHLYLVPQSAHLSQSDFGVLFPNLTKYVMKAVEPEKTVELNVRAILAVVKGAGLPVDSLVNGEDHILEADKVGGKERWVRVPLIDA